MNAVPNDAAILKRVCDIAAEVAAVDSDRVSPDSHFYGDLNYDSLDAVDFVMKIEEAFDVSVDDEKAETIQTPREAFAVLLDLLASKQA